MEPPPRPHARCETIRLRSRCFATRSSSMCNEASALIERVSYAPTITEGHDYSVSILTPEGRLVSHGQRDQAPHMGTFESSIQHLVKEVSGFTPATSSSTTTRTRAAPTRTT